MGGSALVERVQALSEKDTGNAKNSPQFQRRSAGTEGQHSMTDVGKAGEQDCERGKRELRNGQGLTPYWDDHALVTPRYRASARVLLGAV